MAFKTRWYLLQIYIKHITSWTVVEWCQQLLINQSPLSCKKKVYISDWMKLRKKAYTRSICKPIYHPNLVRDLKQCEDYEKLSIYWVYCPSRKTLSYYPPPSIAPQVTGPASSISSQTRANRYSTYLQLPTISQFARSTYADGFQQQCRHAIEVSYTAV